MKTLGIIPARYASTRFPGKPLVPIAGKPLLQHVVERCQQAGSIAEVIVATDDDRIAEAAKHWCRVELTKAEHPSGTDRVAEVASRNDCDAVVNIQGDEPLIEPSVIDAVAHALNTSEMSTAATVIHDSSAVNSAAIVKVVMDRSARALYFSRSPIPFLREPASSSSESPYLRHLGIYGYLRTTLLRFVQWPVSALEQAEKLEQLRALENGIQIAVVRVEDQGIGVDTPEDVARVEAILAKD